MGISLFSVAATGSDQAANRIRLDFSNSSRYVGSYDHFKGGKLAENYWNFQEVKISDNGVNHLIELEGKRLNAYLDSVGVWTIGVGATFYQDKRKVKKGDKITDQQCVDLLKFHLTWAQDSVNNLVKVPLNQNQFDALVGFVFNIGRTAFRNSTLLRELNSGNYDKAADQFLRWVKQPELMGRRRKERNLFTKK